MKTLEIKRQESKNIYLAIRKLQLEERLPLDAIDERLRIPKKRVHYLYKRHRRADLVMKSFEKSLAEKNKPKIPDEYLKYLP